MMWQSERRSVVALLAITFIIYTIIHSGRLGLW